MRDISYTVRQKGTINKYCYYAGFWENRNHWTKNLSQSVSWETKKEAERLNPACGKGEVNVLL